MENVVGNLVWLKAYETEVNLQSRLWLDSFNPVSKTTQEFGKIVKNLM